MNFLRLPSPDESRRILTPEELALIRDEADIPILAEIKRLSPRGLDYFEGILPKPEFVSDYIRTEIGWVRTECWLLGIKLRRCPTESELSGDYKAHNLSLRFRAFYALKFPERVAEYPPRESRQDARVSA